MKLISAVLPLLLLASACASSSAGKQAAGEDGDPLRVSHVDYRSNRRLELVNEAHTSRLEQYSEVRANANCKVQANDVLSGLVEILYQYDFGDYQHPGAAPADGGGTWAWALEIDGPNGPTHVLAGPGLPDAEKRALRRYAAAFLDIYNATYSLQAVEVDAGDSPFENPARRRN
jgi:hypothetical protein